MKRSYLTGWLQVGEELLQQIHVVEAVDMLLRSS